MLITDNVSHYPKLDFVQQLMPNIRVSCAYSHTIVDNYTHYLQECQENL